MEKLSLARQLELLQQARRFFAMRSMLKTSKLIENLISDLENNRKKDFTNVFIHIEETYSDEIRKKGEYQYSCYLAIKKIFVDAIGVGIRPLLEDVFPIANDWFEANKNVQRISEVYQQDMGDEPRVLLYCFVYLIYCEGGYKSWMKILLYILCRTCGESITVDELSEKPLRTIKDMMNKRGIDLILFQGYLNGEVRNGIAHGHLFWSNTTKQLTIQHRVKGKVVWEKPFSVQEFYDFVFLIAVIPDLCFEIFELILISDICTVYSRTA